MLLLALLSSPAATAQQAGDRVLEFGWVHQRPQEDNRPPRNRLRSNPLFPAAGIEESFRSESVEVRAPNVNTLGLTFKYFLTDHWAVAVSGGVPRKSGLYARGKVGPTGPSRLVLNMDLGREEFNPVAEARQWSPVLLMEYHFGNPGDRLRPYLGFGASYTFWTGLELDDELEAEVNRRFGTPLAAAAGRPGPTDTDAEIDPSIAPALSLGLRWRLTPRWSLGANVIYLHLQTTETVTIDAADGTRLVTSQTALQFNPLAFGVLLGYRF